MFVRHVQAYESVHGRYGFCIRSVESGTVLQYGNALSLVVCNIMYVKEKGRLITYKSDDEKKSNCLEGMTGGWSRM